MKNRKGIPKPEHGSIEWHRIRHRDEQGRVRFGASEAPALMGVSKFSNVIDLAIAKLNEPEVSEPNEAMMRGNRLEPALVDYASELLGEKVQTPDEMFPMDRFIATLDGLTVGGDTIVECKTTTFYSSDDALPEDYYWQVLAQLGCCPWAQRVIVVVLDKRMRFGWWEVTRNQDIENDIDRLFYRAQEVAEYIDRGEIPQGIPLTETQVKTLYPDPFGEIELSMAEYDAVRMWLAAKEATKLAEEQEQALKDNVAGILGNAESATYAGHKVVSFKARKGMLRLDTKSLEKDHPDLVAKYKVMGSSTRVLKGA